MYIGVNREGLLSMLPKEFSPETGAKFVIDNNIVEVFQINKVFVPQVKLVMKPLQERMRIRKEDEEAAAAAAAAVVEEAQTPKKRRKK